MSQVERLYSSLVNLAPVGIFRTDAQGRMIFANQALLQMAGITADDLSDERWALLHHPDDRERVWKAWGVLRNGSLATEPIINRLVRPDGGVTWVHTRAIPSLDDEGRLEGYIGVVTDITQERMFHTEAKRLSRLYATLSRVNAIIVHVDNEAELFDQVCEAIANAGAFEQASLSLVDWERRKLHQKNSCGVLRTPPHFLERDLDDPDMRSPSVLTLLAGEMTVINDYPNDSRLSEKSRVAGKKINLAATATVPLYRAGRLYGTLSIASHEKDFFTEEACKLVAEIGQSVSFALDNIDTASRQRRAEAAVARSERHLNITLRSIGDAVLVADTVGRVTLMNPVAEALTGWREAEAIGRPTEQVFRIINEETRKTAESSVEQVLREGVVVGLANRTLLIARDGTERPIADSGAPIRYEDDGEIEGVVLVFRDQSEEYHMQKALRDSEQLYSTLAVNVPVGVYLADSSGELRYANERFLNILGLNASRLSLAAAAAAIHPDDRERMTEAWHRACACREATDFGAYRYQYADSSVCWVQGMITPVFDARGGLSCFAGVVKDITQEREHLEHIERLSRFNAMRSQMNAAIAYSQSEQSLYERICNVATEGGGFEAAQLHIVDEPAQLVRAVARSGRYAEVLEQVRVLDIGPDASWTPLKEGVRSGRTVVAVDMTTDKRYDLYWRDVVRNNGFSGGCLVPLVVSGKVIAALSLYAHKDDLRDEGVLELIDELGRDVSRALENLQHEQQRRRAEEELARNEERLRLALAATNIGIYEVDYATTRMSMDAVCARMLNLGDAPMSADIDVIFSLSTIREKERLYRLHDELYRGLRIDYSTESPRTLPDGSTRWIRHHGVVTTERTVDGKPVRMLGVMTDITATRSLEERDRLAAKVFDNSSEAILILDAKKRTIVMANHAASRITGCEARDMLGLNARQFRSALHDDAFYDEMRQALLATGSWQGEIWRKRQSGEAYPALATISLLRDQEGNPTYMIVQEIDISAQKEFEQRISQLAYRDGLTELPNRTLLRDRVEQGIAGAAREHHSLALLFLDLDHFKTINDSLGHAVGDRLLKEIAVRLTHSVREVDTVGRLGGDEFLILLPDGDADAAAHVAQKLLEECSRPFKVEPHSLTVTPSIGVALYPRDGADFDELLKSADTAMYRAKDEGRNAYRFYTPEMNQTVFQRMMLESSLRRALDNKEFVLHYQPKFELSSRKLVGVEALIRWRQPEMGMISPAQFIPVAEESGLIESIGKWVISESLRQVKAWRKAGLPPLRVAVNVSARQFAAKNVIDLVTNILASTGLPGDALEIEITESLLAQDMSYTLDVLQRLKRLGIHISVDDFGTGYSSLSYLKRFPIDRLKIDQSFVRDLVKDADDRAIAAAVVTMGHSLGMRVIAEGVETEAQMNILSEMGCDEVQGYYLGRPIPAAEMSRALRDYAAMCKPSAISRARSRKAA